MAYVYRYINLKKAEVCYVGKVTKDSDFGYDPLLARHEQHKREDWYKAIGNENLVLQYIELDSHVDADIYETWLIQFYDTGQLVNKAKTGWGRSRIDLYSAIYGHWRTFRGAGQQGAEREVREQVNSLVNVLLKSTEGLFYNIDSALADFNTRVFEIQQDLRKGYTLSRYDAQDDFRRAKANKEE